MCSSSLCTCLHHMVILRTRNKITDFFMILAWASPFNFSCLPFTATLSPVSCTEVRPIGTALMVRRTVIGRQCNSVETSQPGDRTTNPDIVMPECYASSQRVDLLARVVITPVRHTHTRLHHNKSVI